MLGKGLEMDLNESLTDLFWTPGSQELAEMLESARAHPNLPELQLQIGVAYLRQMDPDKALAHLGRALELEDGLAVRCALACAWEEKGQLFRSLEHLQAAQESSPDQPRLLYALGYCAERVGKPDQAAEHYVRCLQLDDGYIPARQRLAAVDLVLQDLAGAIEQYAVLRNLEPEQGWVRSVLGHLYYRAGRYSDAVGEFETSIAMEPENWAMSDEDIDQLITNGQVEKAVLQIERLIDQQGPFPDLYVRLGDLLSQSGHDDDALQAYREALELQGNYLEAMVKIGTHHLIYGRWEEAAESFFQAAELNDFLLMNYVGTGAAQLADNRREEAMRSFDLAAAVEPNSTLLLTEMARLQLKAALADQFSEDFASGQSVSVRQLEIDGQELITRQLQRHKAELQRNPDQADVRYRYGVLLRAENQLTEAAEQFELAAQIRPPYTFAILKRGITLQDLGEIEMAIEIFRNAMDVSQDQIDQHYRLGLLYTDRRRFEEAVREMEQAEDDTDHPPRIRNGLALSLQHMGLMDRAAAAWRSLCRMAPPAASPGL
jgi:tetratricopeptide (TPR) repeat protein